MFIVYVVYLKLETFANRFGCIDNDHYVTLHCQTDQLRPFYNIMSFLLINLLREIVSDFPDFFFRRDSRVIKH